MSSSKLEFAINNNPSSATRMTPQQFELAVINGQIVAYCQTNDFTTAVRRAVNDEMFWRDLLQKYNVTSTVQNELTRYLPSAVQLEANKIVGSMVQSQLDNYTKIQIPSHVAKCLAEQITGFLNHHTQMNEILEKHSKDLNGKLSVSAKKTLDEVTNEPQYHKVTESHLDNMTKRFEAKMKELDSQSSSQLSQQQSTFNSALATMKKQVTDEVQALKDANTKLGEQERKINDLRGELMMFKWAFGAMAVVTMVGFYFIKK